MMHVVAAVTHSSASKPMIYMQHKKLTERNNQVNNLW